MPHPLRPRPWRRALATGLACAATGLTVTATAAGAGTARPAPVPPPPRTEITQACGGTSWWAGTTNVCDGRVVYRDYVNDDHGADLGQTGYEQGTQNAFGTLAHPAGDRRYPVDAISSADLVRLELKRVGTRVEVVAELAALYRPDDTVLALAVDSDGLATTGGGPWTGPAGGVAVRSAGWDQLVLLRSGDPTTNTIRGSFALPSAATWRVQAVTARPDGTVMNVAFRGPDEQAAYRIGYSLAPESTPTGQGAWFEDRQARALADGDISAFGQQVQTKDLKGGVQRLARIAPGLHERVYTSAHTVAATSGPPTESMSYVGVKGRGSGGSATAFAQVFNLLGKYQPYGVYVPRTASPYGMQMEWHGSNQGIVAQINQPGMQARFGEELGRLLVAPSARGPNGYGSDVSERDLLDVMADVRSALPVDASRVFSSGYSQGGYIAWRMAMLYPDVFAGFTTWVGFTGNITNGTPATGTVDVTAGAVGNMVDFVGNVRHVPGSMLFGAADELVQVTTAEEMRKRFDAGDSAYEWWQHTAADHFTFSVQDDWRKEAAYSKDQRLVRDPARVTYRTARFLGNEALGIRHDRAYWVSSVRPRTSAYADTDLTALGCGRTVPVTAKASGAGPDPVPYVTDARRVVGTTALPASRSLTGSLVNVESLTVDAARTCSTGALTYDITSDGPAVVSLTDGRRIGLQAGPNRGVLPA